MKNYSTSKLCAFIFICCFIVFNTNKTFSQEQNIYELTSTNNNDRKEFNNLSKKLHSTYYYKANKLVNKYGNSDPVRITLNDGNSLDILKLDNPKYKKVELITIKLKSASDLNKSLELIDNEIFSELKFIYIKCLFNCNSNQIKEFTKKMNTSEVRIFYTIVKPS